MNQCVLLPSAATGSPVMHIAARAGARCESAGGSILGCIHWVGAASSSSSMLSPGYRGFPDMLVSAVRQCMCCSGPETCYVIRPVPNANSAQICVSQ